MTDFIFAPEFPPTRAGIANYSHSMAAYFATFRREVRVYTLNPLAKGGPYKLISPSWRYDPKSWPLPIRKVLSLAFKQFQSRFYRHRVERSILNSFHKGDRIIITTLFVNYSLALIKSCIDKNIPFEIVLHGLDILELSAGSDTFFEKILLRSEKIWVNSNSTQQVLLRTNVDVNGKVTVFQPLLETCAIDNMVLLSRSHLEAIWGIPDGMRWICSVCRLTERKGIHIAIEAVAKFLQKNEQFIYIVAGTGPQESQLRRLIPPALTSRMILAGDISELEKFSLLDCSEVFLMPNQELPNDTEGFGISFIEASYMKCWVIGGNNGGVPEAVDVASNGFLVESGSAGIERIVEILEDLSTTKQPEKLDGGRQTVAKNFSLARSWNHNFS